MPNTAFRLRAAANTVGTVVGLTLVLTGVTGGIAADRLWHVQQVLNAAARAAATNEAQNGCWTAQTSQIVTHILQQNGLPTSGSHAVQIRESTPQTTGYGHTVKASLSWNVPISIVRLQLPVAVPVTATMTLPSEYVALGANTPNSACEDPNGGLFFAAGQDPGNGNGGTGVLTTSGTASSGTLSRDPSGTVVTSGTSSGSSGTVIGTAPIACIDGSCSPVMRDPWTGTTTSGTGSSGTTTGTAPISCWDGHCTVIGTTTGTTTSGTTTGTAPIECSGAGVCQPVFHSGTTGTYPGYPNQPVTGTTGTYPGYPNQPVSCGYTTVDESVYVPASQTCTPVSHEVCHSEQIGYKPVCTYYTGVGLICHAIPRYGETCQTVTTESCTTVPGHWTTKPVEKYQCT